MAYERRRPGVAAVTHRWVYVGMVVAITLLLVNRIGILTVGDGKTYSNIEAAVKAARPGDRIEVYPSAAGYPQSAIYVDKPGLAIVGMKGRIALDGAGFDYSGVGRVPRAIFQVNPGADNVTIENFELKNAHNESYNGAGIRIYAANRVTVRNCDIHANDMGIMSNGKPGDLHSAEFQLISGCEIHENGSTKDPGQNHNLYLGGTSVRVEFCNIHHSLTGHNFKSRAHFNLVRYCWIHDSANREFDFVESWDTERTHSNAVLLGDVIEKDPSCVGNRMTINFGAEKGKRNGTLYLLNDTILTPFLAPVVNLSAPDSAAVLERNVILNAEQAHPQLIGFDRGAAANRCSGYYNWLSVGYSAGDTKIDAWTKFHGKARTDSPFAHADYGYQSVACDKPGYFEYVDGEGRQESVSIERRYAGNGRWLPAKSAFLGAG